MHIISQLFGFGDDRYHGQQVILIFNLWCISSKKCSRSEGHSVDHKSKPKG